MTTTTFDLDRHLAECRERMAQLVGEILTHSRVGDRFETVDGPLVLNHQAFAADVDVDDILERRATAISAILTEDGRTANYREWHRGPVADGDWVRYERYTAEGRVAHGFVHRTSRMLVQAG